MVRVIQVRIKGDWPRKLVYPEIVADQRLPDELP